MMDEQESDFLPWTLAAVAVLIMTVAVRINANDPAEPRPAVHDPGEQGQEQHGTDHSPGRFPEQPPVRV